MESLIYCQKHKDLEIYGWCLMSSHLHMIARATGRQILPEILRDLKKYTAKAIIQQIEDEPESRKEWLLARFKIVSSPQASNDSARVIDARQQVRGGQNRPAKGGHFERLFQEGLNYYKIILDSCVERYKFPK